MNLLDSLTNLIWNTLWLIYQISEWLSSHVLKILQIINNVYITFLCFLKKKKTYLPASLRILFKVAIYFSSSILYLLIKRSLYISQSSLIFIIWRFTKKFWCPRVLKGFVYPRFQLKKLISYVSNLNRTIQIWRIIIRNHCDSVCMPWRRGSVMLKVCCVVFVRYVRDLRALRVCTYFMAVVRALMSLKTSRLICVFVNVLEMNLVCVCGYAVYLHYQLQHKHYIRITATAQFNPYIYNAYSCGQKYTVPLFYHI